MKMNVRTVDDQSVLKYHISVAAKIAAGSCGQKRRQKSCSFFIPDLTLNKSMINIPPPPMDVFGEAVCRITDRAKIQTTWIETNVKSNLQLLRTFLIQPIFIKIAVGSVDLSFSKDRMRTFLIRSSCRRKCSRINLSKIFESLYLQ